MNRSILQFIGISLLILAVFFVGIKWIFGDFDKKYSEEELIAHYDENEAQIQELTRYFQDIVPEGKEIDIEFESKSKLFRFQISEINPSDNSQTTIFTKWDLTIPKDIPDEIMTSINWDETTFQTLWEKLEAVNCIQISSGKPIQIGFQRTGMGIYSYFIAEDMDKEALASLKKYRTDMTFFRENVAWQYNGGAAN